MTPANTNVFDFNRCRVLPKPNRQAELQHELKRLRDCDDDALLIRGLIDSRVKELEGFTANLVRVKMMRDKHQANVDKLLNSIEDSHA